MKRIVQYQTVIKKEKGPYSEEEVIYVIAMDEDGVLWIKNPSYTNWLRF